MDTAEAVYYRMGQTMNDRYGQKFDIGNYEKNISTYIENDVLAEDRYLFDRVRTVSGVNTLLSDKKTFYFNYRVFRNDLVQYFQCQLVKPSRGWNEFVIGFKNIDSEKTLELAQQKKLEEAFAALESVNASLHEEMSVSNALSQEYSSLFKIDTASGKLTLYRTDGVGIKPDVLQKLMAFGDFEAILSKYIDTFIVPEDRDRLREATKLDVLPERVPDVGLYKMGYRRIMNGVTSYYEMNVVKTTDQNGTVTFILGLRDVDEEMRRQLKQTREMETQREIIEGLGSEYYSVLLVDPERDTVTAYRTQGGRRPLHRRLFQTPRRLLVQRAAQLFGGKGFSEQPAGFYGKTLPRPYSYGRRGLFPDLRKANRQRDHLPADQGIVRTRERRQAGGGNRNQKCG